MKTKTALGSVVMDEVIFPITSIRFEDGLLIVWCKAGVLTARPPGLTQIEVFDGQGNQVVSTEIESPGWYAHKATNFLRLPIRLSNPSAPVS